MADASVQAVRSRWLRRCGCCCAPALLVGVSVGLVVALQCARAANAGVFVSIRNAGSSPLQDVRVVAGDATVDLGDIREHGGRLARIVVDEEGEVYVFVNATDGTDRVREAGVYLEPRTLGWIRIQMNADGIVSVQDWSF